MSLATTIKTRFYKTPLFKGLLTSYQEENKVAVIPKEQLVDLAKASQDKVEMEKSIPSMVQQEIQKLQQIETNSAMRFRNVQNYNRQSNSDHKPYADLPFSYMRRMAQIYPVARACINRRIRQITQLDWDITTIDEVKDEKGYDEQIKLVKAFFKHPLGGKSRLRELLTYIVDDLLTLDAISYEYQRTRGGSLLHLVPVDPSTIALKLTETGSTPTPPDTAYVQYIAGKKIAEFTIDEMLYDKMNNRTNSPYGLAPVESLILQVESAIRGAMYNLGYFRENNIPEGFVDLPEEVARTKAQVEEWQQWFDALLAGDNKMVHRLKFLPGGAKYTQTKKPEDMSFERFELWLLQLTCAIFDVQPQDIGITLNVNKATSESQGDIGQSRGLIPLANFIKEIFDSLIQDELGFEALQFSWGNLNPVDRKEEAEVNKLEIDSGVASVDEVRIKKGLEPIGLEHLIMTGSGPMMVKDIMAGKVGPSASLAQADRQMEANAKAKAEGDKGGKTDLNDPNNGAGGNVDNSGEEKQKMELADIRLWRKCIYKDLDNGKKLRVDFETENISPEIYEEIKKGLEHVTSKTQAKILFDQYIDPEIKGAMTLVKFAHELRKIEQDVSSQ